MSARLKKWRRRSGSARWTLLVVLTVCAASVLLALALDSDRDGMSDGYELLYGLNPADPSDATLDPDGDFLSNAEEAELSTNPWQADTDLDGWPDLIDAVPASRAYLEFDPHFVFGNEYLYPMPPWVESVYKVGGSAWALGSRSNGVWAVYGSPKARYLEANAPALMIELNRAVLTNDLVIELVVTASAGAELRLELLDVAGRKLHHVDGNLAGCAAPEPSAKAGGDGKKGLRQLLLVPLARHPTGSMLKFWVEKGESVELEELLLYVDQNDNRLDAEQEAQIGKSDTAPCDHNRKILLDLVENWPDPFSPANGALELFAAYRVRPTEGLNDDERAEEKKGYFIRQRVDVKNMAGAVVWTETRDFAIDPARIWHHTKYAPIGTETAWPGTTANGALAPDGLYRYQISGTYLRLDPKNGKEKVIASSDTLSGTVLLDSTKPVTSAAQTPAPNNNGWNKTDVTVTLTATDAGNGPAATYYAVDGGAPVEGTTFTLVSEGIHAVQYWSMDNAGNIEPLNTLSVKIDKTPPAIRAEVSPLPNAAGWNKTDVTVTFSAEDQPGLSGVASLTAPVTVSTEGAGQAVTGTAEDRAGNFAHASVTINLDKTSPEIISFSPANGQVTEDQRPKVGIAFRDPLSEVDSASVVLKLDGVDVTAGATVTATGVTCQTTVDLSAGDHTVAVSLDDRADNAIAGQVVFTVGTGDTDKDGLPDWWENEYGFDPFNGGGITSVGWWKLDETTGTNVHDSSVYANDGILTNADPANAWVTGIAGNGLLLDGIDDYVQIDDSFSMKPPAVSVALWIKPAYDYTNGTAIFFSKKQPGASYGYELAYSNGALSFLVCASGDKSVRKTINLMATNWYHVVGTYGGNYLRLYVNAIEEAETNIAWGTSEWSIQHTNTNPRIGASPGATPTNYFAGIVDEVQVYDYELTTNEVHGIYEVGADLDGDGISDWWEFANSTSPASGDTDGDGLSDFEEITYLGTSPVSPLDGRALLDAARRRIVMHWNMLYATPLSFTNLSGSAADLSDLNTALQTLSGHFVKPE